MGFYGRRYLPSLLCTDWSNPMEEQKKNSLVRYVLLSNGIIDILAAISLFFPVFELPLPGYMSYTNQLAFVAGGWGIAALSFGIGRIRTSFRSEFYWVMVILGFIEGIFLALFCLINVIFLEMNWLQVMLPLFVGSIFGILYFVSLIALNRLNRLV
jgi:hypothetical protein